MRSWVREWHGAAAFFVLIAIATLLSPSPVLAWDGNGQGEADWANAQVGKYGWTTPNGNYWESIQGGVGWCAKFVANCNGAENANVADANALKTEMINAGRMRYTALTNAPVGALAFFSLSAYGHVGLHVGGGNVVHAGYSEWVRRDYYTVPGAYVGWAYPPPDRWPGRPDATGNPKGALDLVASEQPGTVKVAGWDFDPNVPTQAIDVHVYIGGPAGSANAEAVALTANGSRPDVGAAYPGVGNNHGYDRTITTSKRGTQSVYVYAINAPGTPGGNILLGSRTVTVASLPTTISLSAPSTCGYGLGTLTGALLTGTGEAVANKVVSIEWAYDNSNWVALNQLTTGSDGGFAIGIAPTQTTYYRVGFAGDAAYDGCTSETKTVTPRVSLTTPSAPKTAYRALSFTSAGYLKPRHAVGSYPTRLQCYRYQSGRWVLRKSVPAKASNYSSYSKYSRSVSLPHAGKWRIRAYHAGDPLNAATYSSYRYFTIK